MKLFDNVADARDLWRVTGSFGEVAGEVTREGNTFRTAGDGYVLTSHYTESEEGVFDYAGTFENVSGEPLTLRRLQAQFAFTGDFEVFTQCNVWQNESKGAWQELVTCTGAATESIRTSFGASPMLALWNKQTASGVVFHLLAEYAWEMKAQVVPLPGEAKEVSVTIGLNSTGLALDVAPGESVRTPRILCYSFRNKRDLDCHKLHAYCNRILPPYRMPVIYNTWLYRFDAMTTENVLAQVEKAAYVGAEYFVLDAGWFGKTRNWVTSRGDWKENPETLGGRMKEIADAVRAHGMKFGLWLEVETADAESDILKEHPDHFIAYEGQRLLDFAKREAVDTLYETVIGLIERYGIEFIKFDFNQDLPISVTHTAFYDYLTGFEGFIDRLREAYPSLYLQNCASGGLRMDMTGALRFDGFWPSDNESPYEGMRIVANTMLRLPPQLIERWVVVRSLEHFLPSYDGKEVDKILACNDCVWDRVVEVSQSYLEGFMLGGGVGFSLDFNALSQNFLDFLKETVASRKAQTAFWQNAVGRILTDVKDIRVIQYSDPAFETVKLVIFRENIRQNALDIRPVVDPAATYRIDGDKTVSGAGLMRDGMTIPLPGQHGQASIITLNKI